MKEWYCGKCRALIQVYEDYEPVYCCSGFPEGCYCHGDEMNPLFCDKCGREIYDDQWYEVNYEEED